mmetsp:Transcript_113206/g.283411  ORF Transcript_113206/g.283411 Transcript_113206/m.283411 type:complete len:396 (+) Transcript_113206:52-1239(+)|eukprot:CAMPEP_0115617336 /NCGR_PEP_ID=MMETSP0272-20121206/23594_1 /TAXON_ID=71861 /ORGANISM="Scrippsiella trochoidea, Strain CCMP3099" /LENGTH=395 /DNA_ID=CAMNT_0003053293 /DNA_START=47 /DNA_END=1234 /DNA_ORIENTATION=-
MAPFGLRTALLGFGVARVATGALPSSYDAEAGLPQATLAPQNQASCGSCYSFSTTEMLSARIARLEQTHPGLLKQSLQAYGGTLSPEALVAFGAGSGDGLGCDGGWPDKAGEFFQKFGVPHGSCAPYISGDCTEDADNVTHDGCTLDNKLAWGTCWGSGEKGEWTSWGTKDWGEIADIKSVVGEEDMKADIFAHGPLTTAFDFFSEFNDYQSGVMTQFTPDTGGHAVLIVGWGSDEKGTPYWRVRNSWGADWGERGYFRILRGQNARQIEVNGVSFVLAASGSDRSVSASASKQRGHRVSNSSMPGAWVEREVNEEPVLLAAAALRMHQNISDMEIVRARSQVVRGINVELHARAASQKLVSVAHKPPACHNLGAPGFSIVKVEIVHETMETIVV